jgi:hypothetical protein
MIVWHSQMLNEIRGRIDNSFDDTPHFSTQAKMRNISEAEIWQLRFRGELHAIEVGSDGEDLWPLPKYVLRFRRTDGSELEGIFATDGRSLCGITLFVRTARQGKVLRLAA